MTLREAALYCEGILYRDIRLAWHIEAFARQKRLQPLNKILNIKSQDQTPEQQEKILRSIFQPMTDKK